MTPETLHYLCQACGQTFPRWSGQCPSCGEWNALQEETAQAALRTSKTRPASLLKAQVENPISISEVDCKTETRSATGLAEVDRVLGGGVVSGSVILLSGEPGIGKSTLMLQVAAFLSRKEKVLYVSGEESLWQVRLRAERLGALSSNLLLYPETNLFAVEKAIKDTRPKQVIIDSIQTVFREDVSAAPGTVSQVRECANFLLSIAKGVGIPIFMVGHVTKDGNIAGPRVLEHSVDVVLYFEGERHKQFRVLRAEKNRFGSTHEVGIFEMKEQGLVEVANPSQVFLSERPEGLPGSVVTAAMEGGRPLLVEIQALSAPTKMVYPARKVTGVEFNRVAMVLAVLERQLSFPLAAQDIYVNAAGGVRVGEPAMDLPVAAAIASSFKNKAIAESSLVLGEIGLAGEIRSVPQVVPRIKEAEKFGFKKVVLPQANVKELKNTAVQIVAVASVKEALKEMLGI